jgi:radical SAM superfamily enzyme YgiQ (UPF0313 family)|tara:strand:+ start:848 stop:2290 length:1443 start_codon:yes stop_codon:yes gene_type:complete
MKVLLINPFYEISKYYGKLSKLAFVFPPVGLTYLAGMVRAKGHSVYIYDFQVEKRDFWEFIKEFKPDFIGITCQTALFYSTVRLARDIRQKFPKLPIVVGGAHGSYRPHDFLEQGHDIDLVVRGEGEMTLLELLDYYQHQGRSLKEINGITFKQNGEIVDNPARALIKDLDILPIPAIDLLPLQEYHVSPDNYIGGQVGLVATSRGCPYNCIFCACKEAFNRSYRPRDLDKVFQEIKYYIDQYDISQLFVMDDCFTLDRKRTMAFCDRMIKTGYNKKVLWWCQSRADLADEELLRKMREAGCMILSFGIESGVQRLLDNIAKRITLEQIRKTVKLAKKIGFQPRGSFIIGLPTESFRDSLRTIRFALSLPLSQTKFGLATPYPGTRLWDIALAEGQVKDKGENWDRFTVWSSYSKYDPTYIAKGRKIWELRMLQKFANTIFYLQPRVIFSFLKRIKNFSDFKYFVKSILIFFKASFTKNR